MEYKTEWNVTPEGMPVKVNVVDKHSRPLAVGVLFMDGDKLSLQSPAVDATLSKPAAEATTTGAGATGEAGV